METDPLPAPCAILFSIQFHPITSSLAVGIVAIVLLLIISALISGAEAAYFSVSPQERLKIKSKVSRKNKYLIRNLEAPEQLLATVVVVNNFVNVTIVILTVVMTNALVSQSDYSWEFFVFQVVVVTTFMLLFSQIIPRLYVARQPVKVAKMVALPVYFLTRILRPVNALLIYSTSFVNNRIRSHSQQISVDELSQALELTSKSELQDDREILKGIVRFGHKSVVEIMRSRVDVVTADITDSYLQIIKLVTETGFSRIPVYSESFDNIKGILYIKDLLPHVSKGASFRWQSLIRPPFFVPETKKIDDLLEEFQKNKVHMAIVVDEYGGTSGIVTLEDVLEEIVGEITDEFDEEEKFYTKLAENKFLFDGKTLLNNFCTVTGVEESVFDDVKGEADTLAGLILELKGEIPQKNDIITCKNYVFSIEAADNRRIKQLKVEIRPTDD